MLPPLKSGGSTLELGYPTLESCYSTSEYPSTTESELSHRNPSCSTSGVGCSYLCNRAVPPLRVLLPLYPCHSTSEGPSTTESELPHRKPSRSTSGIRSAPPPNPSRSTQESDLPYLRTRVVPHQKSDLSHHIIQHAT